MPDSPFAMVDTSSEFIRVFSYPHLTEITVFGVGKDLENEFYYYSDGNKWFMLSADTVPEGWHQVIIGRAEREFCNTELQIERVAI